MSFNNKNSFLFQEGVLNNGFSLVNESIHSFGKGSNFLFNSDPQELSRDSFSQSLSNWSNSSTCQFGILKAPQLCCRTYFTQNQIIAQPESDTCEFKAYSFPFNRQKNQTVQKTICGFLNCNGGHIYIGIQQNTITKQHKVVGGTYNQAQKQQILKVIRTNAQLIEPDVIVNNKIKISFVPVKICLYPYSFIPGRFVVKIKVSPGVRDEVYTVKIQSGDVLVCMRTQNQILTYDTKRQFRKILSIQKERAQYPLQKPRKLHKYDCKKPQEGVRIFQETNRMIRGRKQRSPVSQNPDDTINRTNSRNSGNENGNCNRSHEEKQAHDQKMIINFDIGRSSIMSRDRTNRRTQKSPQRKKIDKEAQTNQLRIINQTININKTSNNQNQQDFDSKEKSTQINKSNDSVNLSPNGKKKKKKNKKNHNKSAINNQQEVKKEKQDEDDLQIHSRQKKKFNRSKSKSKLKANVSNIKLVLNRSFQTPPKSQGKVIDKARFAYERVISRVYNSPQSDEKKGSQRINQQTNQENCEKDIQQQKEKPYNKRAVSRNLINNTQTIRNSVFSQQVNPKYNDKQHWQKDNRNYSKKDRNETGNKSLDRSYQKSKKKRNKKNANTSKIFDKKATIEYKLNLTNYLVQGSQVLSSPFHNSNYQINEFISELKSIGHNNHRIFAFSGFSSSRIQIILNQFASIGQYTFYEFQNLFVYKFNKQTDEAILKLALTKALQHQYTPNANNSSNLNDSSQNMYYHHLPNNFKQIQYNNTTRKKNNLTLSLKHNQQQSITQQPKQRRNEPQTKKSIRIIFKITTRLKILKYNSLEEETREQIKQTIMMIEELTVKRNGSGVKFYFEKNSQLPKNKEFVFNNLYYSLLAFLQLRNLDITLIFY